MGWLCRKRYPGRRCWRLPLQDDIEIMAYDGILKCFGKSDAWFSAVVVTDGKGSHRDDLYAGYTDDRMRQIRNDRHIQNFAKDVTERIRRFM